MTKYTNWFDGNTKPVRNGVYRRRIQKTDGFVHTCYSYWNGENWRSYSYDVASAHMLRNNKSDYQHEPWCGLAVKPKSGIRSKRPQAK